MTEEELRQNALQSVLACQDTEKASGYLEYLSRKNAGYPDLLDLPKT